MDREKLNERLNGNLDLYIEKDENTIVLLDEDGKKHTEGDLPSCIKHNDGITEHMTPYMELWHKHGKLHRELPNPAVIMHYDGQVAAKYFIEGEEVEYYG